MVTGTAIFFIVFFYSGTFLNWPGLKGLYQTFAAWYQTGSNGNGHEKPWPYWLELVDALRMAGLDRAGPLSGVPVLSGT